MVRVTLDQIATCIVNNIHLGCQLVSCLIGGRDSVADDCVELPPGEDLVVDERLLLAVEEDGDGVALVDVPHDAGAEVLVAPRQHAVPDPVAQVQVELVQLRNVEVVRGQPRCVKGESITGNTNVQLIS